jgi:hypothetical protein
MVYNRSTRNDNNNKRKEIIMSEVKIDQYSTVARINGLAVLIYDYSADFCQVRYIGPEGKQITKHQFRVDTEKLRKF